MAQLAMPESLIAYIGIGANLGPAAQSVEGAMKELKDHADMTLLAQSGLWRTKPIDAQGPDFCNAIAQIQTTLAPTALMQELLKIESQFGRIRSVRNAPRTLDLDVIAIDGMRLNQELLHIPHPRAHSRAFVLIPLCEVNDTVMLGAKHESRSAKDWLAMLTPAQLAEVRGW